MNRFIPGMSFVAVNHHFSLGFHEGVGIRNGQTFFRVEP